MINLERTLRDIRDRYLRRYKDEELPAEIYSEDLPRKKVSFCTTCMNRLFHLRQTYLKNIEDNLDYGNVEFVLVNYNSGDDLDNWARKNLASYIREGVVNYYRTDVPEVFHASIAKNLAHKVATGDIVVNLDGDNYTGKDFAFYVNYKMQQVGDNAVLHFKKAPYWGTEGRIVMSKDLFMKVGGYDEAFAAIGHEDDDLIDRARALGGVYENIQVENFLHYLSNTTEEKAVNCTKDNVNYYVLNSINKETSIRNLQEGKFVANLNGWGMLPLYRNFSDEARIYEAFRPQERNSEALR